MSPTVRSSIKGNTILLESFSFDYSTIKHIYMLLEKANTGFSFNNYRHHNGNNGKNSYKKIYPNTEHDIIMIGWYLETCNVIENIFVVITRITQGIAFATQH